VASARQPQLHELHQVPSRSRSWSAHRQTHHEIHPLGSLPIALPIGVLTVLIAGVAHAITVIGPREAAADEAAAHVSAEAVTSAAGTAATIAGDFLIGWGALAAIVELRRNVNFAFTQSLLMTAEDFKEFHAGFTGKRKPNFKGR